MKRIGLLTLATALPALGIVVLLMMLRGEEKAALSILAQGSNNTSIRWVASVRTVEVGR